MAMVANEEQRIFQYSVREFCAATANVEQLRKLRDGADRIGYEPDVWVKMCELGWSGVLIPDQFGGTDMGMRTLGVVLEEIGVHLAPCPVLSTAILGVKALTLGGNEAQKQAHLPAIAEGSKRFALALEESSRHQPYGSQLSATKHGTSYRLEGSKVMVIDGASSDVIITLARTSGAPGSAEGLSLFLVPADCAGLTCEVIRTVDSRGHANLTYNGVEVGEDALIGTVDKAAVILDPLLDYARIATATELYGVTQRAFDMTLEYLKYREQFGVVIGSFQALKHRMADMFCELQLAQSTVLAALDSADTQQGTALSINASLCKAKMGEVARIVTNEAVQMHGGIGVTDEHNIGLYLKHARMLECRFGQSLWHRDRYATLQRY